MTKINSFEELFAKWETETEKYKNLKRISEWHDKVKTKILKPFHDELLAYVNKHGADALTAEVMDKLYSGVALEMKALETIYAKGCAIINAKYQ